jgi:hypothetical protein
MAVQTKAQVSNRASSTGKCQGKLKAIVIVSAVEAWDVIAALHRIIRYKKVEQGRAERKWNPYLNFDNEYASFPDDDHRSSNTPKIRLDVNDKSRLHARHTPLLNLFFRLEKLLSVP